MRGQNSGPLLSAVFIDYDNIYQSLKRKNDDAAKRFAKDVSFWLSQIENGQLLTATNQSRQPQNRQLILNRCYGNPVPRRNSSDNTTDMSSFPFVRHHFLRAGLEIIDCPPLTSQLKNSAEIRIVMDINDLMQHQTRFDEFIILSSDADFTPLLYRLRSHARRTVVYVNDLTAAPYAAIADAEIREATLLDSLLEGREDLMEVVVPTETSDTVPELPSKHHSSPQIEAIRGEIISNVVSWVKNAGHPLALDTLSERITRTLGHERTLGTGWAGMGTFGTLLHKGLPPTFRVSGQAPYFVYDICLPVGVESSLKSEDDTSSLNPASNAESANGSVSDKSGQSHVKEKNSVPSSDNEAPSVGSANHPRGAIATNSSTPQSAPETSEPGLDPSTIKVVSTAGNSLTMQPSEGTQSSSKAPNQTNVSSPDPIHQHPVPSTAQPSAAETPQNPSISNPAPLISALSDTQQNIAFVPSPTSSPYSVLPVHFSYSAQFSDPPSFSQQQLLSYPLQSIPSGTASTIPSQYPASRPYPQHSSRASYPPQVEHSNYSTQPRAVTYSSRPPAPSYPVQRAQTPYVAPPAAAPNTRYPPSSSTGRREIQSPYPFPSSAASSSHTRSQTQHVPLQSERAKHPAKPGYAAPKGFPEPSYRSSGFSESIPPSPTQKQFVAGPTQSQGPRSFENRSSVSAKPILKPHISSVTQSQNSTISITSEIPAYSSSTPSTVTQMTSPPTIPSASTPSNKDVTTPDKLAAMQKSIMRIQNTCQVPALDPQEYRILFNVMAQEISANGLSGAQTLTNVSQRAAEQNVKVRRDDIRFVLEVVSEADPWFEQGSSAEIFSSRFKNFVITRCRNKDLQLSSAEIDVIDLWFGGGSDTERSGRSLVSETSPSHSFLSDTLLEGSRSKEAPSSGVSASDNEKTPILNRNRGTA